ncbi:MAG: MATE family efflux transporter [Spirochaetaceae bacterium]|nr:MATE family efflux transporter [Spirochaetaceae bacterium]
MHQYLREYLKDSRFRKTMLGIALPIILQMLLTNGLSFVDTMMISRLGESEVAAVGLANQMFFLVFLIFFGITSGTGIFIAQFWGNKDEKGIHYVVGLSLVGTMVFSVPFALVSWLIPHELMRLFTPDPVVVQLGVEYLKVIAPSYILSGISFSFAMALRSIERPRIPLAATAISLGLNTVMNMVLIFGLLGFPALGVKGAAIATLISRGIELIVLLTLIFSRQLPVAASFREYLGFDSALLKRFFITAGPVLLNEIAWSLGMVMYKVVFARMGTDVVAAANITESIQGLFFVVLMGTGTTAAIMIGKKIGEGRKNEAYQFARYFLIQGFISGLFLGALMSATAPAIVLILNMKPETIRIVRLTLMAIGILIPIKAFNLHMIVGILRSGGDTAFSFITEFLGVWGIGVPMAFLAGLYFNLSLPAVYLLVGLEEVFKFIMTGLRFRSGKWINDLTRKEKIETAP